MLDWLVTIEMKNGQLVEHYVQADDIAGAIRDVEWLGGRVVSVTEA